MPKSRWVPIDYQDCVEMNRNQEPEEERRQSLYPFIYLSKIGGSRGNLISLPDDGRVDRFPPGQNKGFDVLCFGNKCR
jgi:hypothetical protein